MPRPKTKETLHEEIQKERKALEQFLSTLTPEQCFLYAWKTTLLEQTLADVEGDCLKDGFEKHWSAFHDRVVQPLLEEKPPVSIPEICARHGIESEARASNMIATVKKRFQAALRRRLRSTVTSEAEVEEELREMLGYG